MALLSADRGLTQKWTIGGHLPTTLVALKKQLASPRFEFYDWRSNYIVVIDREHPMVKRHLNEIAVLDVFVRNVHPEGFMDLGALPREDLKLVIDHITHFNTTYDLESLSRTTIAVGMGITFNIEGPGGKMKGSSGGTLISDANRRRIREKPVARSTNEAEIRQRNEAKRADLEAQFSTNVSLVAQAIYYPGEAMGEAGKALDKTLAMIALEKELAAKRLAARLGIPSDLSSGPIPMGRLSPEEHSMLVENFMGMWKINGFASADEARTFLNGSGSVWKFTDFSIRLSDFGLPLGRFKGG